MVTAPAASAPRWAAASMPYAPPETTVQPRSPRSAASSPATCAPYPVAARDPTIETERREAWRRSAGPRSHSAYGRAGPLRIVGADEPDAVAAGVSQARVVGQPGQAEPPATERRLQCAPTGRGVVGSGRRVRQRACLDSGQD